MSKHSATAVTLFTFAAALVACGPSKPANDPSTESASSEGGEAKKKADDETPKWDSSSETAENAASPGGSPAKSTSAEMAPPSTPAPTPTARRSDQYDKEATEVVLKRAARQVKANCGHAKDEDGNEKGPWGKTTITITLGHNGHAKGATVPAPYEGKPTGKCAIQAFSNLTFPPWGGPDTPVDWPIEIDQPK